MPGGRGCTGEEVCGNFAWRHPGCLEEVVGVFHGEGTILMCYSVLLCTLYSVLLSDVLWFSQVWSKQANTASRNRCYHQCQDTAHSHYTAGSANSHYTAGSGNSHFASVSVRNIVTPTAQSLRMCVADIFIAFFFFIVLFTI